MRMAMAQRNPIVGDINGNLELIRDTLNKIKDNNVDLVIFSELFLSAYPPKDLLTFDWYINQLEDGLDKVIEMSRQYPEIGILFGHARRTGSSIGKGLVNSAILVENGEFLFEQDKILLPTYDVFDEQRYFDAGSPDRSKVFDYKGEKLGISICEDAWNDPDYEDKVMYDCNPIEILANQGATLMINLTASPYHLYKDVGRFHRSANHAKKWSVPFITVGQVGANDELIFDGRSVAVDSEGKLIQSLPAFEEDIFVIDTEDTVDNRQYHALPKMESLHKALVLGVRDYMRKCGFKKAVIGLSGGIDSALVACLAVDAIGKENVRGITMPSHYSSSGSVDDSKKLAQNLDIQLDEVPIKGIYDSFIKELDEPFKEYQQDVTEENLQARIRGNILMAFSNKTGALVLTTGNKSELAVGYCTLYGDMNGGLAVISDLPKTEVYNLAKWYNRHDEIIPDIIITKPPSAELAPDQKDQDTLPDYDILDAILIRYLEEGKSPKEIIADGFEDETVNWVCRTVDRNEYKRWQAAPGLRVTSKSFGVGRRMPIASRRS
jgi:NAD+ synthase (glutamine-hydrolysing)